MKESYLLDMSFNNVVFTGRNKLYGAYQLRKNYSKHMALALMVATTTFAAGLGWPLLNPQASKETQQAGKEKLKDDIITIIPGIDIMPPPPKAEAIPEPKTAAPDQPNVKTITHVQPKVVPDHHQGPDVDVPTEAQLKGAIIATTTQEGEASGTPNLLGIETAPGGTGSGTGEEHENTVHEYVADMPYFEGGEEGLMRYISKRIKYPRQAVAEKIEGVVVVSFIVNQYGKVTAPVVLKGLGYGTDEEALRVISSLPDWTPGKQNGKPVAVRYNLPIRFNMQR